MPTTRLRLTPKTNNLDSIEVRISALDRDMTEFRTALIDLNKKFDQNFSEIAREFRASLQSLSAQVTERSKTPWTVIWSGIGVAVVIVGMIGAMFYGPLRSELDTIRISNARSYEQLVQRDQRIWDEIIRNIRTLSFIEGSLRKGRE